MGLVIFSKLAKLTNNISFFFNQMKSMTFMVAKDSMLLCYSCGAEVCIHFIMVMNDLVHKFEILSGSDLKMQCLAVRQQIFINKY